MPIHDEITEAVLAREEVARYLQAGGESKGPSARERVEAYLDEMRTTQRHAIYKALRHPLYPILRKVDRRAEGVDHIRKATAAGRVVYISNHKSHLDYVLEPLALVDFEIRPPVIAAGINLFGGPLGVINRHVTGAIPIRRNTKDPVYLVTLKAYVAEVLNRHDVFFYIEGGRSYTGEFKAPKTGLVHATLQAEIANLLIIPVAIAYDLVLEDRTLARQGVKKSQRPFSRELAEMVGSAVGYQTRSFTCFGEPARDQGLRSPLAPRRPRSRPPGARAHQRAAQGAADRARRGRDAPVERAGRSPRPHRRPGRRAARSGRRTSTSPTRRRSWSAAPSCSSIVTRWPSTPASIASAIARCCATTRDRSGT